MSAYDFTVTGGDGTPVPLSRYAGRVLLIVNTASQCGYTPQLAGLQELWERFEADGLTVLGFPCNQFGGQDPGSDDEIQQFCQRNYGVTFPVMAKIDVTGRDADPLFQWLTHEAPGLLGTARIKWNFTKFLVGRDGAVVARYRPTEPPSAIASDIETALKVPVPQG